MSENRFFETMQRQAGEIQTGAGGLQPIELNVVADDSGNLLIENMTDEIWEQLKTRNYYVKLIVSGNSSENEILLRANLYIASFITSDQLGVENTEIVVTVPGSLEPSRYITLIRNKNDNTGEIRTQLITSVAGYEPNIIGDITKGSYIKYIASDTPLVGPSIAVYNSSWHVGDIIWDSNRTGFSFSESNINNYWGTTYLRLGNDTPYGGITLLLKLTINNIDYTLINQNNTISSFTILNDDLSTTVISCKSTYEHDSCTLEFKAVKDKTDITETFKNSITNISLYAL